MFCSIPTKMLHWHDFPSSKGYSSINFHISNHNKPLTLPTRCLNSRRRRRQGIQPMYGTGWMAKPPPYGHYNYGPPPPIYTQNGPIPPQQTGNTFNSNDGYYGHHGQHGQHGQQDGIELQQPPNAYTRGGEDVYEAPMGPPPGKTAEGDGIIR
ncbi:hypothetical protein OCU04_006499 [Sclerotinia nivalis]|uniref:Uncharacterized protein n=1 Tax=Sclerotinia nivalis TaxID=352851 RepID=A0A9X0AJV8_9HELO|nr:hypothetical protein OCU04_006499 [Sclerotinia nivalis]